MTSSNNATHNATATGRNVTHEITGETAPEYQLAEIGSSRPDFRDVARLPDGSFAYVCDCAGVFGLYRKIGARHAGGPEIEGRDRIRTAPASTVHVARPAPSRIEAVATPEDLIGWVAR